MHAVAKPPSFHNLRNVSHANVSDFIVANADLIKFLGAAKEGEVRCIKICIENGMFCQING